MSEFEQPEENAENMVLRPPVVTILGHVDHGKTSLLDKIRNANVAAGEAGGITQHTAAWMVSWRRRKAKRVTFIDTPGHQAFTSMRARGANMTDVVVLVVSAAEGVQPQTIESINHAKAAGVPIVVAMNKIDRPDANEQGARPACRPRTEPRRVGRRHRSRPHQRRHRPGHHGTDRNARSTRPDLLELKADPTAPSRGTVIESRIDRGPGPVATVLVQDGTLHVGDVHPVRPRLRPGPQLLNDRGEIDHRSRPVNCRSSSAV